MLKHNKSLITIAILGAGNSLNAVLGFIFLLATAKTLSLEEFGMFALFTSILLTLAKLLDFGMNSVYVTNSIALAGSESNLDSIGLQTDKEQISKVFSDTFVFLKFLFFLVSIPIFIILMCYFGLLNMTSLLIFILGMVGYLINSFLYAVLQKNELYSQLFILNFLPALIKGTAAILIFTSIINVNYLTTSAIFSLSLLSDLFLIGFLKELKFNLKFKLKKASVKALLQQASPAGLSQLLNEAWPSINNGISKTINGYTDVGIFSLANKISSTFTLISYSIFTVLLPKNANLKIKNKKYDFKETYFISLGIIALSILAILVGGFFIKTVFGEKFTESISLLNILLFSSALTSIHVFIENYFYIEQKTSYIFLINFSKLVVFVTSTVFLVYLYKLTGLATANLIASLYGVLATIFLVKHLDKKSSSN